MHQNWFGSCYGVRSMNALTVTEGGSLTRILEGLSTAVLVFDHDLRLTFLNPAGEMMFAHSATRSVGMHATELLMDGAGMQERLQEVLTSHSPYTEREVPLVLYGGRRITADYTLTPLDDVNHGTPEVLVELLQVDRHLRIVREESLIEQHQAARKLVRGLAHEIKNPLGGLRGAAQLLERELGNNDDLREYTRVIIGEADRLRQLVNRMLGPNQVPKFRATNVHQVLEHVRTLVLAECGGGLELERDYDPSLPDLHADPEMLIQALLNIVRNAAEALDGNGRIVLRTRIKRKITVGHNRFRLAVSIAIIDQGPGIPPDMLETIFYPMVTGRPEGTGLGLSIAQSMVNSHGGLIECTSRPGRTKFTILLPLESVDD